jgi:hypothetical protein
MILNFGVWLFYPKKPAPNSTASAPGISQDPTHARLFLPGGQRKNGRFEVFEFSLNDGRTMVERWSKDGRRMVEG